MDPQQLVSLLHRQLGRVPTLLELYGAMGVQPVQAPGQEAGAEDPLSEFLRMRDAWQSQMVRLLFLGDQSRPSPLLGPNQDRPSLQVGHPHALPFP